MEGNVPSGTNLRAGWRPLQGGIRNSCSACIRTNPVSNLNAANIAISEGKVEQAKRYLAKAETSPEKQLAEAGIAMLEGDLDRAETLLLPLKDNLGLAEDVANNLEQIATKRAE